MYNDAQYDIVHTEYYSRMIARACELIYIIQMNSGNCGGELCVKALAQKATIPNGVRTCVDYA